MHVIPGANYMRDEALWRLEENDEGSPQSIG